MLARPFARTPARSAALCASAVLSLASVPPTAAATGPAVPGARARTVDVKHVAIDLRFDWQKKRALGTTAITLTPLKPTNKITLDAGMLTIQSITHANGASLAFEYDGGDKNDGLAITLDRVYSAKEPLTITIAYHTNWVNASDPNNLAGSNGKGLRFFEPTFTEPKKRKQIWSMGEPESNRYWFPSVDALDDMRTTELTATVEPPLMAISNGRLVETRTNADGTRSFHWRTDVPYANYLTSFVVGEYTDVEQEAEGVKLHSYGYPDEAEAVAASVERLPDMVRYFSKVTGVKYPFSSYTQVFVQDLPWGAGSMIASTLTENMVDDFRTHADYLYLWDGLEAEALASQWFGSLLTARDWRHAWLNRAFSHYFDSLYDEHRNGRENFLLWKRAFDQSTYASDWASGVRHAVVPSDPSKAAEFAVDNTPYLRGALALHMLRKELREDVWWKAIRRYVASNAGRSVTTDDFRKAVDEASGTSMGWFFDQWVYRAGHPIFEVTRSYDTAAKRLVVRVKQAQTLDPKADYPQVELFKGHVDIAIDGRVERVWLAPQTENVFTFSAVSEPKLVNFDHEGTWIKELKFDKGLDELLYQAQNDTDVLGRRWAMGELVKAASKDGASAGDKAKIYDAFRHVILSHVHWRVKATALTQLSGMLAPATATGPAHLDDATIEMLLTVIRDEKAWTRSAAIAFLGTTRDPRFADLYIDAFRDPSHPVNYAAAIALGQSGSPKAFDALSSYMKVPSWKGENILCGLAGLKALKDPRAEPIALDALSDTSMPRWYLAVSRWDYRLAAAETLVALGKADVAFPLVLERFKRSMAENDVNDIFSNVFLIATLADPRGKEVFEPLKARFKDDANAMSAVATYEKQLEEALKKP